MKRLIGVLLLLSFGSVQGAAIFSLVESGGDIVLSGSGSVDLTGLSGPASGNTVQDTFMFPSIASFRTGGGANTPVDIYSGVTGPASFGSGGLVPGSGGSGDVFGVSGGTTVQVPDNYISGSLLSGTGIFGGHTFASLGVTPGTYVWSWESDSITLNVGAPVPVPAAVWLFGSAIGPLVWLRRH